MVRLPVQVQPRAGRNEVCGWENGVLKVRVTAAPAQGEANEACLRVLAAWLGLPRSRLCLLSGQRSRRKLVGVVGVSPDELQRPFPAER
ncbi:MAG: DUF167 domain-containing protein [Clostridia bacterium]|nr:DUF167 domain-containing protein [Clostridia bacterium]